MLSLDRLVKLSVSNIYKLAEDPNHDQLPLITSRGSASTGLSPESKIALIGGAGMVGAPALGALLGGAYGAGSGGLEGAIRGAGQGAVRVGGIGLGAGLGGVLSALLNEKIPQVTQLRLPIWGAGLGHALTSALFSDSNKTRSLAQKHRLAKLMANEEKYENEKVKTENEKKADLYDLAGKGINAVGDAVNKGITAVKNVGSQGVDSAIDLSKKLGLSGSKSTINPGYLGNMLGEAVPTGVRQTLLSNLGDNGYNRLLRAGGHAGIGAAIGMGGGALHGLIDPDEEEGTVKSMLMRALSGGAVGGLAGGVVGGVDPMADAAQSALGSMGFGGYK